MSILYGPVESSYLAFATSITAGAVAVDGQLVSRQRHVHQLELRVGEDMSRDRFNGDDHAGLPARELLLL